MLLAVFAVSLGAAGGALLRWGLGAQLNALYPAVPLGTLSANLIGGYLVGVAIAYFAQAASIAPEWRLLIITGFCGGLTTFSTFSAEVVLLLQQGRVLWALAVIALHVVGSLAMTVLGILTWHALALR
jgi:CrcB protein